MLAEVPAEVAGLPTHALVIDDGSRDRTADPMDAAARPSLETGHTRQQPREATYRITRQLN